MVGRLPEQGRVVRVHELVHGAPPGPANGDLAGVVTQQLPTWVGHDRGHGVRQPDRIVRVVEQPGLQRPDHVGRTARPGRDTRHSARRGLAERVAAGRSRARLHEQVERCHDHGQVSRPQLAGEPHRVRQPAAQPGPLRAVADHHEPGPGQPGDLGQAADAVPLAQAADVADDDLREVAVSPGGAQGVVAAPGSEQVGVHAGRPQRREPRVREPVPHPRRRDDEPVGSPGDLVAPLGGRELRPRGRLGHQRRQPELAGLSQRLGADRPGCERVHQVGPEGVQRLVDLVVSPGAEKRATPTEWYAAGPVPPVRIRTSWPAATSRSATWRTVPAAPVSRGSNVPVTSAIRRGLLLLMLEAWPGPVAAEGGSPERRHNPG